uniref:Uncharacterized protein n=1 Tax=Cannabis sativa TaxID=3483 RepID=A0A803PGG2_CANSA
MEDGEEIYDGIRAQFPVTFGKQSKAQTPLELIHNTTRRGGPTTTDGKPSSSFSSSPSVITNDLPTVSSSSKSWLHSLRKPKNQNPNFDTEDDEGGDVMVGPPRPLPESGSGDGEDEDGEMIVGPPRPPAGLVQSDEDDEIIGPPKPPPRSSSSNLSWSPTADRFLCVTGSAQAKIYDRDGLTLGEFVKGDMYIRDLKNTKGHITGLTWGEWHPKTKETILTSSEDGSLRIWDVNNFTSQKQVIKPRLARPARVPVTTCTWDREGKCIAGGIGDGSIQIWNLKPGWGSRPDIYVEKSHTDDITSLKFSSDGRTLLSRSCDDSLKVWDLRQMKAPLKVFNDLPNHYAQTNVAFSPDEQLFLTGTSVERESTTGGLLCFFDRAKLELVSKVGISPTCSVVQCCWHPKLNQIFATSGDKSQGGTHILYDPTISERGALVCVARAPRKKSVDDFEAKPVIHNPHALPLFRDQPSRPGFGGRIGTSQGSLLTQYLLKQGGMIKETWMDEDPREAILKFADVAAKEPKFIAPAYADTQPEPVFAKSDSEDEEK